LFCFNAASGTLHEDLHTFHCCQEYNFAIKELLCNAHYIYIAETHMSLKNTCRKHCSIPTVTMVMRTCQSFSLHAHCMSCLKMCTSPNVAVFCSNFMSYFPETLVEYCPIYSEVIPITPLLLLSRLVLHFT
jgi:hypothetical protein